MSEKVYQFRITLSEIEPKIWRVIQVPENFTFYKLHRAIQDAMGWEDYHLFEFEIKNPKTGKLAKIGIPDEFSNDTLSAKRAKIKNWFSEANRKAVYIYDFGDYWVHDIELEAILHRDRRKVYPKCIAGERACPPEDCGGVYGYYRILELFKNPEKFDDEEKEELLEWLGDYNPEKFDPGKVEFRDSTRRKKRKQQKR